MGTEQKPQHTASSAPNDSATSSATSVSKIAAIPVRLQRLRHDVVQMNTQLQNSEDSLERSENILAETDRIAKQNSAILDEIQKDSISISKRLDNLDTFFKTLESKSNSDQISDSDATRTSFDAGK